jgi:DNA-binding HxlR family transcriptional regulator
MASLDVMLIALQVAIALAIIGFVFFYMQRLQTKLEEALRWIGPASAVVETFSARVNRFQEEIGRLRSQLDILEHKLTHQGSASIINQQRRLVGSTRAGENVLHRTDEGFQGSTVPISESHAITSHHVTGVMAVLKALVEGPKTASQVSKILGKSREHTSRLLKSLTEQGLVQRGSTRPYVYSLTPRGSDLAKSK